MLYKLTQGKTLLLSFPRKVKTSIVLIFDVVFCFLTIWMSNGLLMAEFVPISKELITLWFLSIIIFTPIFLKVGVYGNLFRFGGPPALSVTLKSCVIYGVLFFGSLSLIDITGVQKSIGILQPIIFLVYVFSSRFFIQSFFELNVSNTLSKENKKIMLIYGAGTSGQWLSRALANSKDAMVVGYIDDDKNLQGRNLKGIHVYGDNKLESLVVEKGITDVLLAMPRATVIRRNEIKNHLRRLQVSVRDLPSISDLAHGRVELSELIEPSIQDLLCREEVLPNQTLLSKNITGKNVLVTGAGGSIGSEICRQVFKQKPKKILLFEQNEFALYTIKEQLDDGCSSIDIIPLLGSVQDERRLHEIMSKWRPNTIYHAAAYKHVPLVEHNASEGVKNNVSGTLTTARVALSNKVDDFVLISTDKAVRPTNVMGASKRLSEITLQALSATGPYTKFSMVRFGNVIGSSGSVIPKFKQQIRAGGPVTITHPNITRYFMTIPEAAQLVIQAGALAEGGDVFVLDMGKPVKILELATRMIKLSGFTVRDDKQPYGDIELKIIGLRQGEKLYEELLIGCDNQPTIHEKIMRAREHFISWEQLEPELINLNTALISCDMAVIKAILSKLVPEYTPQ